MSEIDVINFEQVLETSPETVRVSVDKIKGIIHWENYMPSSVYLLKTLEGPYTHNDILTITQSSEWTTF